jgi:hypothetical protein
VSNEVKGGLLSGLGASASMVYALDILGYVNAPYLSRQWQFIVIILGIILFIVGWQVANKPD